jgi:EAL domain-containing protein (putative c-di-GMP-specific phosphodiesterase class I)
MKRRRGGPRVDAAESDEGRDEKLQPTLSSLLYDELTDLPTVPLLLGRIRDSLQTVRQLGLLSISVLRDERVEPLLGWQGYEGLMRDIASFLLEIKQVALRRDDFVSEVMISGNAFVILLSPPRREDRVTYADLDKVRCRIESKLARFVRDRLAAEVVDRYGLYVGCAVMHQTNAVRFQKLVYSALDEAFRDSLEQRKRAQRLDAARFLEVLRAGAVHSVYQPVVDLEERRALGFEALTRVSNGAFPGPERLFKVARENNAIWKLERLCRGRAIEGCRGLAPDQMLFLNVEPDSVRDPELRGETTFNLLRASRLQPSQVVLEMTEHSAVRDMLELRQVLDYFKFLGYRLAMDDVGSGYSGLKAIAELKPDFIKIDMSLIRNIDRHPIKQDLTGTIARFSIRSGITLIAEGVERPEELRCLKEIGVRYAQGFLFARPGPPFPPLVTRVFD